MNETDFIAAMHKGMPPIYIPAGLEVSEYTQTGTILKGNADLELPEAERVGMERAA